MTTATFLGRFQPLHEGHARVIRTYRPAYEQFVLGLGSPEKSRTPENPLAADERREIIYACFPDVDVVSVPDEDRGDAGYETWVQRFVHLTDADVVVSQNDLVKRLVREYTDADIVEQQLHQPERFSGTEIRRRIRGGEPWRELVPNCCVEVVADYADVIKGTAADSA